MNEEKITSSKSFNKGVLCDTDILSALAKVDSLDLLKKVFPKRELLITEYVEDELEEVEKLGFDFPDKILKFCETITLNKEELREYEKTKNDRDLLGLSKTDLKNLVIAKSRNLKLLTNDSSLYRKSSKRGVDVFDLRQIFKALYKEEKLSESEINKILDLIEKEDNTVIKNRKEIFEK